MGAFKNIALEQEVNNINKKIEKAEKNITDEKAIGKLLDIKSELYIDIEDNEDEKNKENIKRYVSIEKALYYIRNINKLENRVFKILAIIVFTLFITIIFSLISTNYYKNELERAIKIRKEDLSNISYWIEENKELKRQYEELEKEYNYAVEQIRINDKIKMSKELEE